MAFRDDVDALLARADALERENRELRKQIAERDDLDDVEAENKQLHDELKQLRKQVADDKAKQEKLKKKERAKKKAARRTARKLEKDNRQLSSWLGKTSAERRDKLLSAGVFGAIVVAIGGFAVYQCARDWDVSYGGERLVDAWIVNGERGEPLVALHFSRVRTRTKGKQRRSATEYHLATLDLATGTVRGSLLLRKPNARSSYKIYRPAGHLAWAQGPGRGLQVVDLRKPAVAKSSADLQAILGNPGSYRVSGARGAVATIVMANGNKRYLDTSGKLHDTRPADGLAPAPTFHCPRKRGFGRLCARQSCAGFVKVAGSTAWKLAYHPAGRFLRDVEPASPSAAPLLRPFLIWNTDRNGCLFDDAGTLLVAHDSSAVGKAKRLVSLLNSKGEILWTHPLDLHMYDTHGATSHDGWIYVLSKHSKRGFYARISKDGKQFVRRPLIPRP